MRYARLMSALPHHRRTMNSDTREPWGISTQFAGTSLLRAAECLFLAYLLAASWRHRRDNGGDGSLAWTCGITYYGQPSDATIRQMLHAGSQTSSIATLSLSVYISLPSLVNTSMWARLRGVLFLAQETVVSLSLLPLLFELMAFTSRRTCV